MTADVAQSVKPHCPGLDVLPFHCIFFVIIGASIHAGYADRVGDAGGVRRFMLVRFTRLSHFFFCLCGHFRLASTC